MSSKLFLLGLFLVFLGTLLTILPSLFIALTNVGNVNIGGGALIMIGPIPILIGANIPPIVLVFLALIMFIVMIFQVYLFLKFRTSKEE
ncbi:MAG: DUF131 domain-containing protein [Thermoproteota archaeon]